MSEEKKDMGEVSDGYHTFNELYEHRSALWIALLKEYTSNATDDWDLTSYPFWVADHYPGWDLLVGENREGKQMSFHVPVVMRPHYEPWLQQKAVSEYIYDGHTSKDVLVRMLK